MDIWTIGEWVGKVGFLSLFVFSGIAHLKDHAAITQYAQYKKVPYPGVAVTVTGLMMLAGSAMILLRWHAIWGALLITAFAWPVALKIHAFWGESDPMARGNERAHFFKNVALGAAAVMYAVAVHRGAF